jgi:hypothetical protein
MTAAPIAFRSAPGKYSFIGTTQLVNGYAEQMGSDGKGSLAVLPCGGLIEFSNTTAGPGRGMIFLPDLDCIYSVHPSSVYKITSDGTATRIGTIPGVDQVELSRNQAGAPQIVVQSNVGAQVIESDTIQFVTDPNLPSGIVSACNANNYTIYGYGDRTYYYSGINNSKSVGALDFSTFASRAGKLLRVDYDRAELFGFCNDWIDVHRSNTGSDAADEPFVFTASINRGIVAPGSLVRSDGTFIWAADDFNIHRLTNYATQVISTHEIARLIGSDVGRADINGFGFDEEGHSFVNFSGTSWSRCYDNATKTWHARQSYGYDRWRAINSVRAWGLTLVQDRLSGKLFRVDRDTFTEDGETMVWQVISPPLHAFPNGFILDALHIDVATGYGSLGSEPKIMVETSRDGGNTFTQYRELSLGVPGKYQARVTARRLGAYYEKGCVIRLSVSDSVARALVATDVSVRPLKR